MYRFVDWGQRPAVLLDMSGRACAKLEPNGPWVWIDRAQAEAFGEILSEEAWRARFEPRFGPLELKNPPPLPFNAFRALALARTFKAAGEREGEEDWTAYGTALEERALAALWAGKRNLDPLS